MHLIPTSLTGRLDCRMYDGFLHAVMCNKMNRERAAVDANFREEDEVFPEWTFR